MSTVHFHSISCFVNEINFYCILVTTVTKSCPSHKWSNSFPGIHTKPHLVAGINCDPLSKNWAQPAFTKSCPSHVHSGPRLGPWLLKFAVPNFGLTL